jgi:hypothetical protein
VKCKIYFLCSENKKEKTMKQPVSFTKRSGSRRSFLKKGAFGAGAAAIAAGLLPGSLAAFDQDQDGAPITKGDIAILTFLSAWSR